MTMPKTKATQKKVPKGALDLYKLILTQLGDANIHMRECRTRVKEYAHAVENAKDRYLAFGPELESASADSRDALLQQQAEALSEYDESLNRRSKLEKKCDTLQKLIRKLYADRDAFERQHGSTLMCPICLDNMLIKTSKSRSMQRTSCDHAFHTKCLVQALRQQGERCPLCQQPVFLRDVDAHAPSVHDMMGGGAPPPAPVGDGAAQAGAAAAGHGHDDDLHQVQQGLADVHLGEEDYGD
jgi:hypothetical protein